MTLSFGTDGVRAHADELTDGFVRALGRAGAGVLGSPGSRFVIGMDTRESGPRIERALRAGVEAAGCVAEVLGVVPTPAVAWVAAADGVPGAMISASHNPFHDNGVKFFARGGRKLDDATEAELEALLAQPANDDPAAGHPAKGDDDAAPEPDVGVPHGFGPGRVAEYEEMVIGSIDGRDLAGMRVAVDCANGAASHVAPEVLGALGVDVHVIHGTPDGRNINEACGSTHPEDLQRAVTEIGAAVGLAFDGDADRVLAVDETGALVDGDHIIALCAQDMRARGRLAHDTVVITVMTNLGFRRAMAAAGITVVETSVGDRYVLEALEQGGFSLGGEQSGHVIFRDLATTGDGLLTGVQLLDLVRRRSESLSELASASMTPCPQVLRNVRVRAGAPAIVDSLADEVAAAQVALGADGRVLVRPSGTEPLVRVMVEATDPAVAAAVADGLVEAVHRTLG